MRKEGREGERGERKENGGGRKKRNVEEGRILSSTLEIVVLQNYLHCIE